MTKPKRMILDISDILTSAPAAGRAGFRQKRTRNNSTCCLVRNDLSLLVSALSESNATRFLKRYSMYVCTYSSDTYVSVCICENTSREATLVFSLILGTCIIWKNITIHPTAETSSYTLREHSPEVTKTRRALHHSSSQPISFPSCLKDDHKKPDNYMERLRKSVNDRGNENCYAAW